MFVRYLFKVALILLALTSPAIAQNTSIEQQKSLTKYLLFRKNIIENKNAAWSLLREIRDLGRVEKWSNVQQRQELAETEQTLKSLSKPTKSFSLYDKEDLAKDIAALDETNKKITAARKEIKDRTDLHKKIKDQILLCKKDSKTAYNKTKQLLEIRKSIESFYLSKYNSQYPQAGVSVITSHLQTAQLLADIGKMDFAVINLEKAEIAGFSKTSEDIYNPQTLLQNLKDIDERLVEITKQSLEDIKNDSMTLTAVIALH